MFPTQRAVSRRAFILVATLLAAGIFVLFGRAQGPSGQPLHVIVKINSSLANDVESALPMQTMELLAGTSGNPRIEAFLSKYAGRKLRPVYPNIVRSKKHNGLTDLQIATAIQRRFAKRARRLHASFHPPEISRTYILEFDPAAKPDLQATLKSLSADADVEFAEQDHLASTNFTPNDPYFSSYGSWGQAYDDLWGIKKIGAPAAWDTTSGAGIVVAVVDTGVDYNHPDIAANIWTNPGEIPNNGIDDDQNGYIDDIRGWDFIGSTYTNPTQSNNPIDHFGHGTHVAGTIAAVGNNGIGVIGVAWQSRIMIVKGLDDSGFGLDSTLGPAIMYAANNGADVISNSWAGTGTSQTISQAIDYAHNLGAVIVAAAGNNSDDARNYFPANSWDAITVAATDHNDFAASFSNYGSKIDVAAPGVDILSLRAAGTSMGTPVDAYYTRADGTSMATPHVSGLAALILAQHAEYSNEDVRQALRQTATVPYSVSGFDGFDVNFGYGRINAATAIALPTVLESKISDPVDGTIITGATPIYGFARGTAFASYTLQYGAGTSPSSWITIQTGTSPAAGTILGTFDPATIPDGIYTILLSTYDSSNHVFLDHVQLTVKYVSITAPVAPLVPSVALEFKPGSLIVTGTASGPSFNDFRLEWAEGINPFSGWSSSGFTLTNGGTSPVSNGVVGTWDTSSITTADFYTIRLFVDNAGFTSDASTLVYLEPSLLSTSWPISLDQAPYLGSGIVPARDASNNIRLTLANPVYGNTTLPAQFWSISPDGTTQNVTQISYGDMLQPAAGSFDGQPGEDALVSQNNNILVFRPDNSSFVLTPPIFSNLQFASIVLEDLNNDSNLEAIALGHNPFNPVAYVYAWKSNGAQLNNNFPITVPDQNSNLWYPLGQRVLAGDINGDGYKEIIVEEGTSSSTFALGLFAHDGTPLSWSAPTFAGTPERFALADLDHNGKLETILIVVGSQTVAHVLQPDGTERAGWPVTLSGFGAESIAVANLNRDGRDQIVISTSSAISVLNPDGSSLSPAWPLLASGASFGPAVLADINGDGRPEILFARSSNASAPSPLLSSVASSSSAQSATANSAAQAGPPQITSQQQLSSDGTAVTESIYVQSSAQAFYGGFPYENMQLVALRSDGSLANSWRLLGAAGNQPFFWATPTVGDFNGDGLVDIGLTYFTISGGGVSGWLNAGAATVLTTGTPFNAAANDWPMIFQNPRNTAVYRPLLNVSIASPASGASVSGVVTISASPADKVATPTVQFQIDGANFGSPITATPYSLAWDTSTASLGSHVITALASDSSSNTAVSPPVNVTVTPPPAIFASPSSLNFGSAIIGSTTAAQTITISNPAQTAYTLSAVNVTGDFAQTSNCIGSLSAGGTCSINVTFTPTVRGSETGALTLSGNFSGPSPTVALSGTGQALAASFSPASITFQPLAVGSTSSAQVLTYSNTGDFAVSISSIVATGDFAETNNCGASLATGASCSINVTFTPTARGTRAGTIVVSGNVNASAALTGTGQAMLVSISPTTLSFGNQAVSTTSAPQTVTVSNTGDFPFYINGWSYGSPYNVVFNGPGYVQPGSAATFTVTFAPTNYGNYPTNFTINGSFPGSPFTIPMSGTGQDTAGLLLPASVTFPNQIVGTNSNVQAVDIINTANLPLTISSIQTTGDFSQTNNCGATLAPSYTCVISITFHPTTTGTRTGSVSVASNARVPISPSSLSGTGVTPLLSFSPAAFSNFGNQRVNTTSAPQAINVSNTGTAPLTITSFTVTAGFNQVNTCGSTLAVNSSCSVSVTFSPTAQGAITGTLTLNSNAPGSPSSFSLAGTGIASVAALSPNSLTFASQLVGTASSAQPVTLTNTGTASLNISSITANTDFTQSNNCPASLAAGANCTINVTFTPTASGTRSGTLSISDDALAGSPQTLALSGAGYTLSAAFSPTSSAFASQRVGTTSSAQTVTLTSTGSGTLSISGFVVSGDFSQSNNCPGSLTSGATCTVSILFVPTARGTRSGTLTLNSNAPGTPPSVSLSGTGIAPVASLSPSSLTFAAQTVSTTSSSQNVTLSNTGDATLDISSITASAGFADSNNCGATLSPGAHCTVSVTFTPTTAGVLAGSLAVTDDAVNGSPQTTSLSGAGVDFSLSASPSSETLTHGSSVNVTMTVSALGGSFNSSVNLACSAGLPKGANCSFSPGGVTPGSGSATSTMRISTNGSTPPGSYVLTIRATAGSIQHTTTVSLQVN